MRALDALRLDASSLLVQTASQSWIAFIAPRPAGIARPTFRSPVVNVGLFRDESYELAVAPKLRVACGGCSVANRILKRTSGLRGRLSGGLGGSLPGTARESGVRKIIKLPFHRH